MGSGYETVDRIRRSWRHAKPNPAENPAWANTHMDVGVLLTEIDRLRGILSLAEEGLANYAQENAKLTNRIEDYRQLLRMTTTESERLVREENEQLRTALQGITSCSTCEACRGAAEIALGLKPVPQLGQSDAKTT